ncbi:hypothetical protein PoB_002555500, partial [Plakobranchus ocellatus]
HEDYTTVSLSNSHGEAEPTASDQPSVAASKEQPALTASTSAEGPARKKQH